jgi:hypothetical protein
MCSFFSSLKVGIGSINGCGFRVSADCGHDDRYYLLRSFWTSSGGLGWSDRNGSRWSYLCGICKLGQARWKLWIFVFINTQNGRRTNERNIIIKKEKEHVGDKRRNVCLPRVANEWRIPDTHTQSRRQAWILPCFSSAVWTIN